MNRSTAVPFLLAAIVGAALWLLASLLTHRREPWDGAAYWGVVYPLSVAASAGLGYRYPQRAWRWALVVFEAQFLAMGVRNGELGNLWPLGMVMFAVLALPAMLAARVAANAGARAAAGGTADADPDAAT
jgi:hypothetical protein